MKYQKQGNQGGWAREVPDWRFHGPYRNYGWEANQSVLPEFRGPGFHFTPDEREQLGPWQHSPSRGGMSGPHIGKSPRSYQRADDRIYEDVCEQMTRHGQLDASDIEVEVTNGEVLLKGEVPNRKSKRLAEDISDSVSGVQDVHNRLQVLERSNTSDLWVDEVGESGVYPASQLEKAPRDSEAQGMASWGQGERGVTGYQDHGESEIHPEGREGKGM